MNSNYTFAIDHYHLLSFRAATKVVSDVGRFLDENQENWDEFKVCELNVIVKRYLDRQEELDQERQIFQTLDKNNRC